MGSFSAHPRFLIIALVLGLVSPCAAQEAVTYEEFGAKGDGETDDLPAICEAHKHANAEGLPVKSKAGATYHLGKRALTAVIATDTHWGGSRFIIDDSGEVERHDRPLFEVRSTLEPLALEIGSLRQGQEMLETAPAADCLVYVENKRQTMYIRRGLNRNSGTAQKEVFILRKDGTIVGGIDWDYEKVTRVKALPIEDETLFVRGGRFTHIANRGQKSGYWGRNILVTRSRTVISGLEQRVTGEGKEGSPYRGFLSAEFCAHVLFENCSVDGRKTYRKIGNAGESVSMGTYGYHAKLVADFRMKGCRMGNDIHDRSRWGVVATNHMKGFLVEDCVLSRVDVHMGVSGGYTIRRTTLGHAGLNAIGKGRLLIEDSTLHGRHLVYFRQDYGSTWDGDVIIRNSRWIPPGGGTPVMFGMSNDGSHDFGYPCSMPRRIGIEGLFIGDDGRPESYKGPVFFGDHSRGAEDGRPFPYRLTERIETKGLTTASGKPPQVSESGKMADAVEWVRK